MKPVALLSLLFFFPATTLFAQDPSDDLSLDRCWVQDLSGQLMCMEREVQSCVLAFAHLPTAGGRYGCYDEAFVQADRALNKVYAGVIKQARRADSKDGLDFREEMVREAQREWLEYRDAQSEVPIAWARISSGVYSGLAHEAAKLTVMQTHVLSRSVPDF